MKNKIIYISMLLTLFLSACSEDFLNVTPEDRLVADGFYRTEEEVRSATASLYGSPWFGFNDELFWLVGDQMAGNLYYTYDQEGQFYYFSFNEGNSHLNGGWQSIFRVVSYANSIINDMPRIASANVSEDVVNKAVGEARFIRAAAYFFLAEYWGEVPIVENSTELVTSNNMMLPRNTRSSLYEFMRRDLEFAAGNLPVSDQPGRVTQWSAKAMLAKLHLTMASNLSDANSAANFTKAKEYAADVINNSGASLMTNYADLFLMANNNNSESLFAFQWKKGGWTLGNSRNSDWARSSILASQQWGGGKGATQDFQKIVEPGDLRRKSIYMTQGDYYPELNKANGGYTYNFETLNPDNPEGAALESPNEVLNHIKKYVVGSSEDNDGQIGLDQDAGNNVYILRLADVYLIYTEASIGADTVTIDGTAVEYFNIIRRRAGLSEKSQVTFNELLRERRVEFCFESMYWFDIKRLYYRDANAALNYLNSQTRHYKYQRINGSENANSWDSYELITTDNPIVVSQSQMFLPIPASEVLTNPKLAEPAVEYQFND